MGKREKYRDLILKEPYKIGHFLGFRNLTPLNNQWIRSFLFEDEDQTLLAHRGSYKTTCLSIAIALMIVLFPDRSILFFRKTDTDVEEIVLQVGNVLRSPVIKYIVQVLYGAELKLIKASVNEIDTNLKTTRKGTSQLVGLGINTSITGKHADIVITDDIVNLKDRTSKAERERTKRAYMELQNVKNRGGRFINTGTPWHKDDAISDMPNVTKYDCYSTGLIERAEIEEIRQKMTPSLFAANYELKHIADGDALFGNPRYTAIRELIYNGIAHIDAAYGGEDSTAFTIAKEQGNTLYMFGKKWEKHVDDCLPEIYMLMDKYRAGTIHCEKNADKGYLAKEISKSGRPVRSYSEKMNKYVKIATYLRANWNNIVWLEETDPEYMSEILDYTETAAHDDTPDSAASIIRQLKDKISVNLFSGGI